MLHEYYFTPISKMPEALAFLEIALKIDYENFELKFYFLGPKVAYLAVKFEAMKPDPTARSHAHSFSCRKHLVYFFSALKACLETVSACAQAQNLRTI